MDQIPKLYSAWPKAPDNIFSVENKTVTLTVDWKSLAYWDVNSHDWAVNPDC
jgi:hypothetical protein